MSSENLGKLGQDLITGFTGYITGYVSYLTGCNQYLIVPKCKTGEEMVKPEGHWFDTSRVEVLDESPTISLIEDEPDGPDKPPATM